MSDGPAEVNFWNKSRMHWQSAGNFSLYFIFPLCWVQVVISYSKETYVIPWEREVAVLDLVMVW